MIDRIFRSGCGHKPEDEVFDFCPICRIKELERRHIQLVRDTENTIDDNRLLKDRIAELEGIIRESKSENEY